jgi:C-terminal processing protease CtpA/Prc
MRILQSTAVLMTLLLSQVQTLDSWATEQTVTHTLKGIVTETAMPPEPWLEPEPVPDVGVVGVDLAITPNQYPVVQSIFKGTPAERAGLRPGDRVLAVNQSSLLGKSRPQVDASISNVPGTAIRFTIERNGKLKEIPLKVTSIREISPDLQALYK